MQGDQNQAIKGLLLFSQPMRPNYTLTLKVAAFVPNLTATIKYFS